MKEIKAENIARDVANNEAKEMIGEFKEFVKKKQIRLDFFTTLRLADYLLSLNNKYRSLDRAIISFRKVK